MEKEIYQILNCFYHPESPKILDYESQSKFNETVALTIRKNLEKLYDIKKK